MKKHLTPYLIVFIFILLLSTTLFFITQKNTSLNEFVQASIYRTPTQPIDNRHYIDQSLDGGGCVRKIWQDNGAYSWYVGHWNGSGECMAIANKSRTTQSFVIPKTPTANPNDTSYALRLGILDLQIKLNQLGFLTESSIDGLLSEPTVAALKKFQSSRKLTPTGFIDQSTLQALSSVQFQKTTVSGKTIWKLPTMKKPIFPKTN